MGHAIVAGGARASAPVTGIKAGDLAVGSSVYLMENGVAVEYLVVNQGKPSGSSLYDDSCDGTWLLRKDCIEARAWDANSSNVLETSDIHTWLNTDMLAKYDSIAQSAIKQVKIPYRKNGGSGGSDQSGANGLSCKVFLLSGYEVGWTTSNIGFLPVDGAVLDYFKGTAGTDAKRIAYMDGAITSWWLRSQSTNVTAGVWFVSSDGYLDRDTAQYYHGIRPALVLPSTTLFDKETLVLKGVA